ncbi:hypothetical protein [Paenibacillus sp. TH7-28]
MEAVFTREDNRDPSCGPRTEESRLEVIRIRPAEMHPGAADASTPEPGEVATAVSSALRTTKRDGFAALLGSFTAVAPCEDQLRLGETLADERTAAGACRGGLVAFTRPQAGGRFTAAPSEAEWNRA